VSWEAVLAIIGIVALVVTVWLARGDARRTFERFQFSLTPLVAVEGGGFGDHGSRRVVNCTVHLEGAGFAHNLILSFFLGPEVNIVGQPPAIFVWLFKRSPGEQGTSFEFLIGEEKIPSPAQSIRLEGRYENVFKQEIRFTQRGVLRATEGRLEFTSGAPEYAWPWKTIRRPGLTTDRMTVRSLIARLRKRF
jgi:hypothetical protein